MNTSDIAIYEREIENFKTLALQKREDLDDNLLAKLVKNLTIFKFLEDVYDSKNHHLQCFVQDSLSIIDSLSHNSIRYYYFIERSSIENFLRIFLELENEDKMGVMKLFKESAKIVDSRKLNCEPEYELISNHYDECCLFVHSNIAAGQPISKYLKDILVKNDFESPQLVNQYLLRFVDLTTQMIKLICEYKENHISNAFYRKKELLIWLRN
ncbi:hypothetical protein [uncultured Exiguobacterium sp.]|uniref:hypothetical protein n=1 Tax=uncultured Exiguobacterium sp. TaxID=202669 RepID=UPI00260053E8|nr:hypothetical protein [uncultured Exiguobacterium sp.]